MSNLEKNADYLSIHLHPIVDKIEFCIMKSDDACLRYNVRKYANTASKLGLTLEQTYAFLKASFDHESWFYNISALELEKQVLQTVLRGMMDAGYDLRRTGDKHV